MSVKLKELPAHKERMKSKTCSLFRETSTGTTVTLLGAW